MGILKAGIGMPSRELVRARANRRSFYRNDDFVRTRAAGAIDGTPSEPGPGTRTVVDTNSLLTIQGGDLFFSGNTGAWGDPGLWLGAMPRVVGLVFIDEFVMGSTGLAGHGFDTNQASSIASCDVRPLATNYLRAYEANAAQGMLHTHTPGETYGAAVALRDVGAYFFVRDGDIWRLGWIGDVYTWFGGAGTNEILYAAAVNYDADFMSVSYIRVAGKFWLPVPIVSDGFGDVPGAVDRSGNGYDGSHNSVGLDAFNGAHYDGEDSHSSLLTSGFSSRFDGATGTAIIRAKVTNLDMWSDGEDRYMFHIYSDADNGVRIFKGATANQIKYQIESGGVTEALSKAGVSETDWITLGATWNRSGTGLHAYYNGSDLGSPQAIANAWDGAGIASFIVGAKDLSPSEEWHGWLSDMIVTFGIEASSGDMSTVHSALEAGTLSRATLDGLFGEDMYVWYRLDESYHSDGEGHAEGVAETLGRGGDGERWDNHTFINNESGQFENRPAGELTSLSNGDFADWTGGNPDDWTVSESLPNSEVSEVADGEFCHGDGGNGACNLYANGAVPYIQQTVLTADKWYSVAFTLHGSCDGSLRVYETSDTGDLGAIDLSVSSIATYVLTGRADERYLRFTVTDTGDITIDDVVVKEIPMEQLFATHLYDTSDVYMMAAFTVTAQHPHVYSQFGFVMCLDDADNPSSFLIGYVDKAAGKAGVDKWIDGVSENLFDGSITYQDGGRLAMAKDGSRIWLHYEEAAGWSHVGDDTLSDPEIVDNKTHGLFSTHGAGDNQGTVQIDDYVAYPRGTDGEYGVIEDMAVGRTST